MLHHPDRPNQLRREPELATEVVEELLVDEGSKDGPVLLPVTVGGSACRKTSNAQEMILPALTRLRKCFESVTPRGSTARASSASGGEASGHQSDHCPFDHRLRVCREAFVVVVKSTTTHDPRQGPSISQRCGRTLNPRCPLGFRTISSVIRQCSATHATRRPA